MIPTYIQVRALEMACDGPVSAADLSMALDKEDRRHYFDRTLSLLRHRGLIDDAGRITDAGRDAMNRAHARWVRLAND